jgi:O-antigen/teichoic acid export membrane protein
VADRVGRRTVERVTPSDSNVRRLFDVRRVYVVVAFVVVNLSAAVTGIVMGRSVGVDEYGRYAVLASQVAVLSVIAQLGTPLHILRADGDDRVVEAAAAAVKVVGTLAVVLAIVATATKLPWTAGVAIVLTAGAAVTNSLVPRIAGTKLAATTQALSVIRRLWSRTLQARARVRVGQHIRPSLVLMLGNSLSSVALVSLPLVATLRLAKDEVGFLRAALSISAIMGGLATFLATQQFLPQLVALRSADNVRHSVWIAAREQLLFLMLLATGFVIGVFVLGGWFVHHTYGVEFAPVASLLHTSAIVESLKAFVSVELGVLFVFGRLRQILVVEAIAGVLIFGAALASTAAFATPRAVVIGVGCAYVVIGALAAVQINRVLPPARA